MSENICKNCKHWGKAEFVLDVPVKYRGYGSCELTHGRIDGPFEESKPVLAFAIDREDYFAELLTAPEFGCNQFEPKENNENPATA